MLVLCLRRPQKGAVRLTKLWTLRRASGIGLIAAIASLALWPLFAVFGSRALALFTLALGVCLLCGVSILTMTAVDLYMRRRGASVRPIRVFDGIWGVLLAAPSALELLALFG